MRKIESIRAVRILRSNRVFNTNSRISEGLIVYPKPKLENPKFKVGAAVTVPGSYDLLEP
jgi:hypothetical protein